MKNPKTAIMPTFHIFTVVHPIGADSNEIEFNIKEAIKLHLEIIADSKTEASHP